MNSEERALGAPNLLKTVPELQQKKELMELKLEELDELSSKIPRPCDPIVLWDRRLSGKKAEPVTNFMYGDVKKLYDRMVATMRHYGGIGLAAPQIGQMVRVAIVDFQETRLVMVNPEVISSAGEGLSIEWEGCLSLPGASARGHAVNNRAKVARAKTFTIKYFDLEGKECEKAASGYLAHAIQHELDHLDGVYFIDRAGPTARAMVQKKFDKFRKLCLPE